MSANDPKPGMATDDRGQQRNQSSTMSRAALTS